MPSNPPKNMPRMVPQLWYDDPGAAIEWLAKVFGFEKTHAFEAPDGRVMHAEMKYLASVIMLGPAALEEQKNSPRTHNAVTQSLYVYVDDVDAHCRHARAAGATIVFEPQDMFWGDRIYYAQDCEGHHWNFAQHVRDIPPEEWTPPEG